MQVTGRTRAAGEHRSLPGVLMELGRFVRIEHSVFALPLVYAGAILAQWGTPSAPAGVVVWLPPTRVLLLLLLAAVGARTAAMALNRIVDRRLDARNPRTSSRALVTGRLSLFQATALVVAALALLVSAAAALNPLCLLLSPIPVVAFAVYPLLKRWTAATHLFLGMTLGMAPLGGWLAIRGDLSGLLPPLLLAALMGAWVAGFDIIYALQDVDVDRAQGLHSLPAALGPTRALALAKVFHILAVFGLLALWLLLPLSRWAMVLVVCIVAVLVWEHTNSHDVQKAFFVANALVSGLILLAITVGVAA